MSSFYGNIKFNNQTPLIFDKIYTSRYQMDQECHSDGIFNGRYILISYGDIRYTPYYKIAPMGEQEFNNNMAAGAVYYITSSESPDGFAQTTVYKAGQDYYIRTEYSIDNTSEFAKNKSLDEQYYNHDYHSTVWQKIWTSTQDSDEITEKYIMVSHLNAETPTIRMIVDAPNDIMEFDESNQVYFLVPTNQHSLNIPGRMSQDDFNNNFNKLYLKDDTEIQGKEPYTLISSLTPTPEWNIDTIYYIYEDEIYKKFPDSKPYVDGMISEELYIDLTQNRNISLYISNGSNSYQLATKWDRLTKYYFMRYRTTDGRPHFDPIMSTDLEYRFHMPRNWKWNNTTDFEYNIAGFYPEKVSDTRKTQNTIVLQNEKSGDEYPLHRKDEPSAGLYQLNNDNELELQREIQEDRKKFYIDLSMLGDAVSRMWDEVYPRDNPHEDNSTRNMFIGNDREPENTTDYPGTLAEAVRKLYYWLGIKSDNNFTKGPWVDPETNKQVDTIFGVLNGASDLLGDFDDTFNLDMFIPIAAEKLEDGSVSYYPNGYDKEITQEGFTQLSINEFELLNNGGAGPLYIKINDGVFEQAESYDFNTQYYRNMNSLLAIFRDWQEAVKSHQGDWTYELDEDYTEVNPLSPRFIRNKPTILTVQNIENPTDETSINWYWKNYAI